MLEKSSLTMELTTFILFWEAHSTNLMDMITAMITRKIKEISPPVLVLNYFLPLK